VLTLMPGSSIGNSKSLRLAACRMMFWRDRSSPHCFKTLNQHYGRAEPDDRAIVNKVCRRHVFRYERSIFLDARVVLPVRLSRVLYRIRGDQPFGLVETRRLQGRGERVGRKVQITNRHPADVKSLTNRLAANFEIAAMTNVSAPDP
jgi:hypothetical protein